MANLSCNVGKCVVYEWCKKQVLCLRSRQVRGAGRGRWCGLGQTVAVTSCVCVLHCWRVGDGACLFAGQSEVFLLYTFLS